MVSLQPKSKPYNNNYHIQLSCLSLITILIALICILLMAVILIQNPKGGGVDSTFGGQSANQMFGAAKSVDFIEKLTWGLGCSYV